MAGCVRSDDGWREWLRLIAVCSALLLIAIVWLYPVMFFRWFKRTITAPESASRLASAIALGVAMSVMPIWGFQMLAAVGLAHVFKLNKVVVVAFSNVSLPPFIPFILYASLSIGGMVTGLPVSLVPDLSSVEEIGSSFVAYATGAVIFGLLLGLASWPLAWGAVKLVKRADIGKKDSGIKNIGKRRRG